MTILFHIHSLNRAGGAERVLVLLANHLQASGKYVIKIVTTEALTISAYPLHPAIEVISQDLDTPSSSVFQAIKNTFLRLRSLRRIIQQNQPNVVISFLAPTNIRLCLAALGLKNVRIIVADRSNPNLEPMSKAWFLMRKLAYNLRADCLIVQSERVKKEYEGYTCRIERIANPLLLPNEMPIINYQEKTILTVARLEWYKNIPLLLKAFQGVLAIYPDWELRIVGDGLQRKELESLAKELGITEKLTFVGNSRAVFSELSRGSIFAFTSIFEGYPNALLEAMAVGLAVISTDCDFGPADMIQDEKNGLLVENKNVDALTKALLMLCENKEIRQKLGTNAKNIAQMHDLGYIAAQWEGIMFCLPSEP